MSAPWQKFYWLTNTWSSELVGNSRRVLVSDMAGKSNISYKAKVLGIDLDKKNALDKVVHEVKLMEDKGFPV